MAKTSAIQKNLKRIKLVKKYAKKRAELKTKESGKVKKVVSTWNLWRVSSKRLLEQFR